MTAPHMEILSLGEKEKHLILEAFRLIRPEDIPKEAQTLRVEFRKIPLYGCIITSASAEAFIQFITGHIQQDDENIRLLINDVQTRLNGDFSTSVTAMMQIIREELKV